MLKLLAILSTIDVKRKLLKKHLLFLRNLLLSFKQILKKILSLKNKAFLLKSEIIFIKNFK